MDLNFAPKDITSDLKLVSPSEASHMLDTMRYEFQRKVDQTYVEEYFRAMQRGEFRPGTEITFAEYNGKLEDMNGQHTLHALVKFGKPFLLRIVIYKCRESAQRHGLYLTFDRNRIRSLTQLYAAYDFANKTGLNSEQTKHLGAAVGLIVSGFVAQGMSRAVLGAYFHSGHIRILCMHDWVDEAIAFFETIKGAPKIISQLLRRAPIMAIALVTFRHTGADASEFWHAVAWDDNLRFDDCRKTLHKWIREHMLKEYEPHIYARYVAAAWNAAWNDRSLQRLTVSPAQTIQPIVLEGTLFDGHHQWVYITEHGAPLNAPIVFHPAEESRVA